MNGLNGSLLNSDKCSYKLARVGAMIVTLHQNDYLVLCILSGSMLQMIGSGRCKKQLQCFWVEIRPPIPFSHTFYGFVLPSLLGTVYFVI
jgi:hypothetical protein